MPHLLVAGAKLVCDHMGTRQVERAGQSLVSIDGKLVLVKGDPKSDPIKDKTIRLCPNLGATIKPCILTLEETEGDSTLIYIQNNPVCLDSVKGLTDGTPPGVVNYEVKEPGQKFVSGEC